ncbi:MAG: hypothetical protein GX567_09935 [Clostridia bacterium]|nr:hypothetical protein [Clostridia bacterium]
MQKCSELEKEIENKDLRIEHLTEFLIKRNKMLFGQKSEKGKYICDGQLSLDGMVLCRGVNHCLIFADRNMMK